MSCRRPAPIAQPANAIYAVSIYTYSWARGCTLTDSRNAATLTLDPGGNAPSLLLRGLRKAFGDVAAVDGLDLEVARGECFGLLGPNGAGKTTTIEICEGLTEADAGTVELLGLDWRPRQRGPRPAASRAALERTAAGPRDPPRAAGQEAFGHVSPPAVPRSRSDRIRYLRYLRYPGPASGRPDRAGRRAPRRGTGRRAGGPSSYSRLVPAVRLRAAHRP